MTMTSDARVVNDRRRKPSSSLLSSTSSFNLWVILLLSAYSLRVSLSPFNGIRIMASSKEKDSSSVISRPSSNNTSDYVGAEEGLIQDAKNYDEELLRMVKERKATGAKRGKVAWLMSGTSFTSLLIRLASNTTSGTNYGMETNPGASAMSVPIYDWSEFGPYWIHPPGNVFSSRDIDKNKQGGDFIRNYDIPPPDSSIITKTHCGSRCVFCPPQEYLETDLSFLGSCLSGSRRVPARIKHRADVDASAIEAAYKNGTLLTYLAGTNTAIQYKKQHVMYDPAVVEKAIHLVRNPFDNLVSRFHHEQKENPKRGKTRWVNRYSNDVTGFKRWCADEDTISERTNDERSANWTLYGYPEDIVKYFHGVSCHAEFLRYVHWHLMSIRVVEILEIPVLFVHYEDYKRGVSKETDRMLSFLNLDRVGTKLPEFHSNKDYSRYFSLEERAAASDLMRRLVEAKGSSSGRDLLERYWVELDHTKLKAQTMSIK
ncbi:hypothetical protein ACHAXA_011521 [Cyclostephanos tholiformis]|uniref:Sulfotransferase domain-containing protein n=1 Tax=Cyclostephanos tholiformis TaxID=382380 RepID=A0ABD3RR94_9STRA